MGAGTVDAGYPLRGEALVVVDMQNSFCHEDGSFARMGNDIEGCRSAIAGCVRLVEAARECDIPIFFVTYAYEADYADGGYLVARIHPEVRDNASMLRGTWDVEVIDELKPQDGDHLVVKNRYSAFVGTDLGATATALGITSMTFCGVTTNICVESSARDAAQLDFGVTVVGDASGELDPDRHTSSLATIRHGFGRVVDTEHLCHAWRSALLADSDGGR